MTARSHTATSFSAGVMLPLMYHYQWLWTNEFHVYALSVLIGALFPDIDEEHSYIGRRFFFIAAPLNKLIGHRTLTHNIFIYIPFVVFGYIQYSFFSLGFGIGAILHILEDSATNSGVKWALKPIFNSFALLPKKIRFSTNQFFENYIYFPLINLIIVLQAFYIGSPILYFFHIQTWRF